MFYFTCYGNIFQQGDGVLHVLHVLVDGLRRKTVISKHTTAVHTSLIEVQHTSAVCCFCAHWKGKLVFSWSEERILADEYGLRFFLWNNFGLAVPRLVIKLRENFVLSQEVNTILHAKWRVLIAYEYWTYLLVVDSYLEPALLYWQVYDEA